MRDAALRRRPASPRCSPCSRSSTCPIPSASSPRWRGCSSPDGVAVFVTPNRLTLGRRTRSSTPTTTSSSTPRSCGALCGRSSAGCELRGLFGSERYMELFDEERATLDRLLRLDPLRLRRLVPHAGQAAALRPACCAATAAADDPRAAGDHRRATSSSAASGLEAALDVCAVCPRRRACPAAGRKLRVWCGAPLGPQRRPAARPHRCPECGAATTDPWPTDEELERRLRRLVPARRRAASPRSATRCCAARAGCWPSRLDAIAPPGPVLDVGAGDGALVDALRRRGREASGSSATATRADVRDEPLERGRGRVGGGRLLALARAPARAGRGDPRRPRGCSRRAASWSSRCPNAAASRRGRSATAGSHLDLPRHLVHLTARALTAGARATRASGSSGSRHVRGGQVVIGWLDGLVGALPGGLDLYQALRRPEARSAPLEPRRRRVAALAAGVAAAAGGRWSARRRGRAAARPAPSTWRPALPERRREAEGHRR